MPFGPANLAILFPISVEAVTAVNVVKRALMRGGACVRRSGGATDIVGESAIGQGLREVNAPDTFRRIEIG